MKTFLFAIVVSGSTVLLTGGGQDTDFDEHLFEEFITMRGGDGIHPVYWYATGEMRSFPDGEVIVRLEGLGADRLVRSTKDRSETYQLHREIFLYRHPETNAVLRHWQGREIKPLKMPYQLYIYSIENGRFEIRAEHGSGGRLQRLGPISVAARRIGEAMTFSLPLFISGQKRAFAHYDFFAAPPGTADRYRLSWVRYDDWPRFPASGRRVMHAVSHRVERWEALPESIRTFIETEAPHYKNPPRDLEEIRQLQKKVPDAAALRHR
jgi:hypothetical protein